MDAVNKTLGSADRKRIRAEIEELIAVEDGMSRTRIGRILGFSPSAVSQVLSGKYKGDADKILQAMAQFLANRQVRVETPLVPFTQTAVTRSVLAVCDRAWAMPTMGLVVTESGCGKTAALKEAARRRGNRGLYIECGEAVSSKRDLLRELAAGLDIADVRARHTCGDLFRAVRSTLAERYSGGKGDPFLLLIDEATTLQPAALNMLRNLHDAAACRCGIVLADTWRLDAELHSAHGIKGGYEQLRSRFGAAYVLPAGAALAGREATEAADVRAVVDTVLASLGHTRAPRGEAYKYLLNLSRRPGRLRNVVHRLQTVQYYAEACGREARYSVAELDFVATLVGGACEIPHSESPFGEPAEPAGKEDAA